MPVPEVDSFVSRHIGPSKADYRSARLVVVFLLGAMVLYTAGYGWYAAIERSERFLMLLYLPLVFSFIWGAESLLRRIPEEEGGTALRRGYIAMYRKNSYSKTRDGKTEVNRWR